MGLFVELKGVSYRDIILDSVPKIHTLLVDGNYDNIINLTQHKEKMKELRTLFVWESLLKCYKDLASNVTSINFLNY